MTHHTLTLPPDMARAVAEGRKTQHRVLLEPEWFELPDQPAHWHDSVPTVMPNLHAITTAEWRKPVFPPYQPGHTLFINGTAYTITNVRVQRVRDITPKDCYKYGIFRRGDIESTAKAHAHAIDTFCHLWNATHGPDAWARNDWVVALTFRKETP